MTDDRKKEIRELAASIDRFSEKYQLIHPTVAIEKLFKDKMQEEYAVQFEGLRQQILVEKDKEKCEALYKQVAELKEESNKRIRIFIEYSDKVLENSARTTRTPNNVFMIILPKSMATIRNKDEKIDFERLDALRLLMAHELGHIALHSGILNLDAPIDSEKEQEANYFAKELIALRRIHDDELIRRS